MDTNLTYSRSVGFSDLNFWLGTVVVGEDRFFFIGPGALVIDDFSSQCLGAFVITPPSLGVTFQFISNF
jgi:hypothetical protein